MIEFDYLIKRDEGDKVVEYKPKAIKNKISSVSYIEGPNSSGKSTLLNIIALGFFGSKSEDDEINSSLKLKLQNMLSSSHQKLVFDVEITFKWRKNIKD